MHEHSGFVVDGHKRARDSNLPIVRSQVEREYSSELSNASNADRKRIRAEIEHKIEKRLNAIAPPDALY